MGTAESGQAHSASGEGAQNTIWRHQLDQAKFPKPANTRILAVANQKGGVGKTTTTVNVAAALASGGLNVVVIDCDPQGNASTALGLDRKEGYISIYEVLIGKSSISDALQVNTHFSNLQYCPSSVGLAGAEIELVSIAGRQQILADALEVFLSQHEDIDYVFLDCPPSLSLLTLNALVAAKEVFIPIQCEYYALEGLSLLLSNIDKIRQSYNQELSLGAILLTMYDRRTRLSEEVALEVRRHFPQATINVGIPRSVRVSEAPSFSQSVITYDPRSSGALAYRQAALDLAVRGVQHHG